MAMARAAGRLGVGVGVGGGWLRHGGGWQRHVGGLPSIVAGEEGPDDDDDDDDKRTPGADGCFLCRVASARCRADESR